MYIQHRTDRIVHFFFLQKDATNFFFYTLKFHYKSRPETICRKKNTFLQLPWDILKNNWAEKFEKLSWYLQWQSQVLFSGLFHSHFLKMDLIQRCIQNPVKHLRWNASSAVNCFCKMLHFRCLIRFWARLCLVC